MEISIVDVSPRPGIEGDICLYAIETGEGLILVEAGPPNGFQRLEKWLLERGYSFSDIKYVLLTHIHLDHGGGAGYIVQRGGRPEIYVHPRGAPHLVDPSKLWRSSLETIGDVARVYGEPLPVPEELVKIPSDGEMVELLGLGFEFIYTPGHAKHHMSIYLEDEDILFTGDSAGLYHGGTVIPTTPPPHNVEESIASIRRMMSLAPGRLGYTHFGIVDDALDWLERYEIVYNKWVNHVERGYREGRGIDEIYRELRRVDLGIEVQERFFRYRGYGEEEVLLSLYGIYSYYEWLETRSSSGS